MFLQRFGMAADQAVLEYLTTTMSEANLDVKGIALMPYRVGKVTSDLLIWAGKLGGAGKLE